MPVNIEYEPNEIKFIFPPYYVEDSAVITFNEKDCSEPVVIDNLTDCSLDWNEKTYTCFVLLPALKKNIVLKDHSVYFDYVQTSKGKYKINSKTVFTLPDNMYSTTDDVMMLVKDLSSLKVIEVLKFNNETIGWVFSLPATISVDELKHIFKDYEVKALDNGQIVVKKKVEIHENEKFNRALLISLGIFIGLILIIGITFIAIFAI